MPNITNVQRAFNQISDKSLEHEGELSLETFMSFFNHAVGQYNLKEDQINELKAMNYPIEVKMPKLKSDQPLSELKGEVVDIKANGGESPKSELSTLIETIRILEEQVLNLTGALAKIGTLTGYGNHLREFKIDKWEPTKKDMNKYS